MIRYVFLLLLIFSIGCKQPDKKVVQRTLAKSDSLKLKRAQAENEWMQDSLKDELIVKDVIGYIKNRKLTRLDTELRLWKDTAISARVNIGNLFSKSIKHAFIRCHVNWKIIFYVYKLDNLQCEIRDEWSELSYLGDEIKDINGDGINDLSIHWEPPSGCCARDNYHVYLYKENDKFSDIIDFINPSFFPKQKLILGVDYGHPGEVPLYKFKWDGFNLDTIEYIYPADKKRRKFYRVKQYGDEDKPNKREVLTSIPMEYKKILGYAWFIDY